MDTEQKTQWTTNLAADEQVQAVIETHGLTKTYKGVLALKSLDLQVQQNSICGFLGPNGAGKTTTIKLLLGLARATCGSGKVFGMDIGRESEEIRCRVGYLAQDPRYYEYLTARETLRFVARFFYKGQKEEVESRVAETLELVGLADKADRPIKGFSGGERQRLGIAQRGGQLSRPADPGRAGCQPGSARTEGRARSDVPHPQTRHDLLLYPYPGRCAKSQRPGCDRQPG